MDGFMGLWKMAADWWPYAGGLESMMGRTRESCYGVVVRQASASQSLQEK